MVGARNSGSCGEEESEEGPEEERLEIMVARSREEGEVLGGDGEKGLVQDLDRKVSLDKMY